MTASWPARGAQNWDVELEANVADLQSQVDLKASSSELAASEAAANATYASKRMFDVKDYGAVGDGVADDSTAIQSALDAVSSSQGGTVHFPRGIYKVNTGLTSSARGLELRGDGAQSYNETESTSVGSVILAAAGVTAFTFNPIGSSLYHQGPRIQGINFKEAGAGKTSTLVKIRAANHGVIRDCTFYGALVGLTLDAQNLDASWWNFDHCLFQTCTTGFSIPTGCGTNFMSGGEFVGCTTGLSVLPSASLTAEVTVVGVKFDSGIGIHTKGHNLRAIGCGFERCNPSVKIERDAGLHATSGLGNSVSDSMFFGSGSETGATIGAGCTDTRLLGVRYSNLGTKVSDSGTGTVRYDGDGLSIDRITNGNFILFSNSGTQIGKLTTDGSNSLLLQNPSATGTMRFKVGTVTSATSIQFQDSTGANVLRIFGNGAVQHDASGAAFTLKGALDHDGSTVGFYNTAPVSKPTVTGSRGGNAALASLLTALAGLGLLTDSSSA